MYVNMYVCRLATLISTIMKRPPGSMYSLFSTKWKLFLNRIATPAFRLLSQPKSAL